MLKFDPLPGTDLLTYLSERPSYTEQAVAEVAGQVLDALAYLHWRGRAYLNLEPANVLVCSGRSLGQTLQVKLANLETAQTVDKEGTEIKGSYNFDYTGGFCAKFAHSFDKCAPKLHIVSTSLRNIAHCFATFCAKFAPFLAKCREI